MSINREAPEPDKLARRGSKKLNIAKVRFRLGADIESVCVNFRWGFSSGIVPNNNQKVIEV